MDENGLVKPFYGLDDCGAVFKLILSNHKNSRLRREIRIFKGLQGATLLGAILFALLIIAISPVQAGLEGQLGPATTAGTLLFRRSQPNSQTVALLSPASSLPAGSALGGAEVEIEGGALVADPGLSFAGQQSNKISVYVVREGDNISQIAEMFKVTPNTIRWANDIGAKGVIHEGQTLVILPITGVRHEVKRGDTVAKLAKLYDADETEILQYNVLESGEDLVVGSVVIIPDGVEHAPEPTPAKSSAGKSAPAVRGAGAPSYAGYYRRPVDGGVRTQGLHGYNAVDLASHLGTSLHAAAAGKVIISRTGGWNGGYGNYVVIEHDNGTQTLYAHNQKNLVAAGQKVTQGEVIALMGSTGNSTGPHVHFEIRGAKNPF